MISQDKVEQSEGIKNRIVYWGGTDNTIIPMMATKAEIDRAKELARINENLAKLKGKTDDKSLAAAIELQSRKRKINKEEAAHQAHMMKKEMELSGLKSKVLNLEEEIGTVQRKGLEYDTKSGKHVKTKGQLVIKLSREYFLQGLHQQNMFNTQKNIAGVLEHINHLKGESVHYDEKVKELADKESAHMTALEGSVDKRFAKNKELIAQNEAAISSYSSALTIVKDSYTQVGEIQAENVGKTRDLAKMYSNMGRGGFQDMTKEMETQLERAKAQADYTINQQLPALQSELNLMAKKMKYMDKESDLYKEMVKDMAEMEGEQVKLKADAEVIVDAAEKNVKHAKLMSKIQGNVAASTQLIVGPFEKIQGLLESNPLGKWVSTLTGLDSHMKSFTDTVGAEMTAAFTPPTVKEGIDKNGKKYFMDLETGRRISEETYDSQKKNGQTMQESLANVQEQAMGAIDAISSSFSQMNAMMGGMLGPALAIVVVLMAVGMALKKIFGGFTELRKEMGLTFGAAAELQSNINITAARFKFMGVSAEDVKGVVGGIQENWGGVGQATEENISLLTGLNAEFGISGEHSSKLITQMMAVGAGSREAAAAQLESVGNLARASGVAPAAIMADVAQSTEFFAGFAKDGGMNLMKTSIAARKLGLNLGTAEKIAESLLDFESSIEAQMEASMMTGRAINTDRARELMLAGDTEGMMKEVTKQIGSQADWNAMNVVQRKSLAKAFGLEASEVGKMMAEQERRANMTQAEIDAEEERAKKQEESGKIMSDIMMFLGDLWAEILIAAKNLWPVIKGIGIALAIAFFPITAIVAGVMLLIWAFNKLNEIFPGIGTALTVISAILAVAWMRSKGIGGSFLKWIPGLDKVGKKLTGMTDTLKDKAKEKMGAAADKVTGKGTKLKKDGTPDKRFGKKADKTKAVKKPKTSKSIGGKKGGKGGFGFMEKIKPKKMIQGAAALLIAAAAMWVAAKALQEFGKVTWTAIAMAGVTLLGLTLVLAILGKLKGQLIQGAVAMLIMSIALIPFAFALQMFTGIDFAQVALGGVAMIGFALAMGLLGFAAPFIIAGAAAVAIMGIALMPFAVALGLLTGIDFEQVKIGGAAMLGLGLALGALGFMAPFIMMGAAAMAIMAVALLPFAVALGLFTGIDFAQVALGGAAMLGLGLALGALGFMAPLIIIGSWALGIMSLALLGFGVALVLVGTGMKMISGSFSSITGEITEMASMYENIGLLAKSFFVLGRSMSSMALGALMLLPALPVLIALNKMGMFGGVSLGGGGEEATESKEENPVEIKLTETNMKLDKLIALMGKDGIMVENLSGIKKNTGTFADGII